MIEGLFDAELALAKLDSNGELLARLDKAIDWEDFRPLLKRVRNSKSNSGRKPYDEILMFKILILQSLYNLSDEATENQILDRLTFKRFLGLKLAETVPDATTIWLFREALTKKGLIKDLFYRFDLQLHARGIEARKGTIIDASIVKSPRQKISKDEKKELEETGNVEEWNEPKSRQKDVEAKWTKKNSKSYFGYKNHISVDAENKIIRKYEVTDASVHDSQIAEKLMDYGNTSGKVYADSAYMSKKFLLFLSCFDFIAKIHRKACRNKPLTRNEKRGNRTKSKIRARVEHVFGMMKMTAGSLILRSIGIARATSKIGLRNITYNMRRATTIYNIQSLTV